MSLLYSLYAFEYKWFNMGKEVHTRLTSIETTWPYYVGFGLPMAVLTTLHPSVIISGGIFALLFPLFIISANEADETSQVFSGPPLRLFAVVVAVTNAVFRHSITVKGRQPTMFKSQQSSPQKKAHFSQTHR
ncbi:hypothetical protein FSP39_020521 [Pinctada imbricata]|uniref:Uncharacterized protein n=1 Tax=Pinctada imbricata TaxID=66713 RepID=A0AA88YL16_PINIB|nr:hypothetical protein FSP39_020521 [Pinctada imbricata]